MSFYGILRATVSAKVGNEVTDDEQKVIAKQLFKHIVDTYAESKKDDKEFSLDAAIADSMFDDYRDEFNKRVTDEKSEDKEVRTTSIELAIKLIDKAYNNRSAYGERIRKRRTKSDESTAEATAESATESTEAAES